MTKEELRKIPFTFVSHLNMEHEHTSTYMNVDYDSGMCSHTKCIDGIACGRTYTHYRHGNKVYKSLKKFLEAIKDVEFKGEGGIKMANYVNHRMEIKAPSEERLEEILDSIQSVNKEDGTITPIDFNNIDPMPEELSMEFSLGEEMVARYLVRDLLDPAPKRWATEYWNSLTEEQQEKCTPNARRMVENILKYEYPNWYEWRCARWGTKWNALEASREKKNVILFQTAWSLPDNLLKTLSSKFGDTTFKVTYADENIGCNCGTAEYKNGEGSYHEPAIGSVEAFELAFTLWPSRREDYVLTENGYEDKEE